MTVQSIRKDSIQSVRLRRRLRCDRLEDRSIPSFGFGSAFAFGGTGDDSGRNIALDSAGNTYVAGPYSGTVDFDPNQTNPGSNHVLTTVANANYVAKYLPDGTFQWVSDLGAYPASGGSVAVGGSAVYASTYGGGSITRLDPDSGAVLWETPVANGGLSNGLAVDSAGNVNVTGRYGASGVFVAQLGSAGNLRWTMTSSAGMYSAGHSIAVDATGNIYTTGQFLGSVTFGNKTLSSSGEYDVFVWKLNSAGASIWAGRMGSAGNDASTGIAVDAGNNVVLSGHFGSSNNNFNPGNGPTVRLSYKGNWDVFVAKLSQANKGAMGLSWARGFGGSGVDGGGGIAVDGTGNVYTIGDFHGSVNFNPTNGPAQTLAAYGGFDVFVSKLNASGNYVAAAQLGGAGDDLNGNIALDGSGNVYVTGVFNGPADFDPTGGVYNLTSNGADDAFVAKLTQTSPQLAAGGAAPGVKTSSITNDQLQPIVAAAIDRWASAGLDAARLNQMRNATVTIANLGGAFLGLTDTAMHGIRIDDDAAGHGWFVDPTPRDDSEFAKPNDPRVRGRMDLVSVVAHELGHLGGFDHDDHADGVMGESLSTGVRRTPIAANLHEVTPVIHRRTMRRR